MLAAPPTPPRLKEEGIDDVGSLIRGYLIEGRPAFRLRQTPNRRRGDRGDPRRPAAWPSGRTPSGTSRGPGGGARDIERFRALVDRRRRGLLRDPRPREQTELLAARCAALGLLSTGSADFHGPENRQFSRFLAFETYGLEPNLGPIAEASSDAA